MIHKLPFYLGHAFELTTLLTLLLFYWMLKKSGPKIVQDNLRIIYYGLVLWIALQGILSFFYVYTNTLAQFPPRIMLLGVFPMLLAILLLFITKKGKEFIDGLSLQYLTLINLVRIPVELVLYLLFINRTIPEVMTFEGRNFDIIAGLTALPMMYLVFSKGQLIKPRLLLAWNIICLALLLNIVITAILSVPSPFQKLGFEQPNIAILYLPFSWLPTFIVPVVLFGHLVSIRQLLKHK